MNAAQRAIDEQLDAAIEADELRPQLREFAFTVELGWPDARGLGFSVRHHALCVALARDCDIKVVRVETPRKAWSWASLIDDLLAVGQLPADAVVTAIGQVKQVPETFVRYMRPNRRDAEADRRR